MEMISVRSSAISAIGYDEISMRMKIRFIQGDTFDFCRVPSHIHQELMNSNSKGTYYNTHIRDRYQC